MERLLVSGVDELVGANLALALAERFDVYGVCHSAQVTLDGRSATRVEPSDPEQLVAAAAAVEPNWIIHCGPTSVASWDLAAASVGAAHEVRLAGRLVELCGRLGARLTWVSTDAVFAGPRMFHDEQSPAVAPGAWPLQVRAVERTLADSDALVVRTHAYGWSVVAGREGFAERLWSALSSGQLPEVDGRRHATPILAADLAPLLARAFDLRLHGLYHMTGAERASPYQFARQLTTAGGWAWPKSAAMTGAATGPVSYLEETSLNSRRARRALELPMPLLAEGLCRLADQATNGWRDRAQVGSYTSAACTNAA